MKIIYHNSFQNFYLYLIYLAFNSTLKFMGKAHSLKISLKEIIFLHKYLDRTLHTLSFYQNIK
jgi:hypothetical protein